MLQKNFSKAIVGKSYLSFLFGVELIWHRHKVVLLDDDRLQFGRLFSNGLVESDIEFLSTWGIDRDIPALKSIRSYIEQRPFLIFYKGKTLRLGSNPLSNARELCRKFPQFFPYGKVLDGFFQRKTTEGESLDFDLEYQNLASRLGTSGFRFKSLENTTKEFLFGQSPTILKDLFFAIQAVINEDPALKKELFEFFYFVRGVYQKRLSNQFSEVELYHLFLCLLSPMYDLDEDSLCVQLEKTFIEKGGHFKRTKVREWKFFKGMPWSIELSSFEGIIHPKKISFLGAWPEEGLPLKIKHKWGKFQAVHFKVPHKEKRLLGREKEKGLWFVPDHMATDIPLWSYEIKDGFLSGEFLYRVKPGTKIEFYKKLIKETMLKDLESWLPGVGRNLEEFQFELGREVYLDQSYHFSAPPLPKLGEVKIYDYSTPFLGGKLKNVSYFGPLKGSPLGLYGQLLELKEIAKYI